MIRRSSVCWADLGDPHGSRPRKRRPVLVIQADAFNASRLATVVADRTANTLSGNYSLYATEYLYTNDVPDGLETDVINFLMSKAVAAQLHDASFISCSDLVRSTLISACPAS